MRKTLLYLLFTALASTTNATPKCIDVASKGIRTDGKNICTKQIQSIIDEVSTEGKGDTIVFSKGKYLTGTIFIKDNVNILLNKDAVIYGSTNPYDYVFQKNDDTGRVDENIGSALIMADGAKNFSISGKGTIDGQGLELALTIDSLHHIGQRIDPDYNIKRMRPTNRPKLFYFCKCANININGVNLKSSSGWGLSFNLCNKIKLINLNLTNRAYWNNDGLDISDCKKVIIKGCDINSADDGVCLKSHNPDGCNENILIENCDIRSSASAVKFGTASWGGFKNIIIRNIRVKDTFRSAIAIESVDGAIIENILVDGVTAQNTGNAIFIRLGHRAGEKPGSVKKVTIRNMKAEIPFTRPDIDYDLRGPEVNFFHNPFPCVISGIDNYDIESVTLENIELTFPGRATKGMAYVGLYRAKQIPEKTKDYPEFTMFGELPAWAFYMRHVKGITFKNVTASILDKDFRPAVVLDDVKEANTKGLIINNKKDNDIVIIK